MNYYGNHLAARYKPNKIIENSEPLYDNYGIPKESSQRKEKAISNYENTNIKFVLPKASHLSETTTEEKPKFFSKIKKSFVFKIAAFLLIFLAVAVNFGIAMKIISDNKHNKKMSAAALSSSLSELTNYINHQQQTNKEFLQLHYNQSINKIITNINKQKVIVNKLEALQNENKNNIQKINGSIQYYANKGYILSDDNWIIPFNGYQYKLIRQIRSWDSAQSSCRSFGGDLASQGFQSLYIRKIVSEAIQQSSFVRIGLSDEFSEGTWRWLSSTGSWDGDYATNDTSLWYQQPPSYHTSSKDCAVLHTSSAYAHPVYCSDGYYFLCEKQM